MFYDSTMFIRLCLCDKVTAGSDGPNREPTRAPKATVKSLSRELSILSRRMRGADEGRSLYPNRGRITAEDLRAHRTRVADLMRSVTPHVANFLADDFDRAINSVGWTKERVAQLAPETAFALKLHSALKHAIAVRDRHFTQMFGDRYRGTPATVTLELQSLIPS